jgi:hypothetical protein
MGENMLSFAHRTTFRNTRGAAEGLREYRIWRTGPGDRHLTAPRLPLSLRMAEVAIRLD